MSDDEEITRRDFVIKSTPVMVTGIVAGMGILTTGCGGGGGVSDAGGAVSTPPSASTPPSDPGQPSANTPTLSAYAVSDGTVMVSCPSGEQCAVDDYAQLNQIFSSMGLQNDAAIDIYEGYLNNTTGPTPPGQPAPNALQPHENGTWWRFFYRLGTVEVDSVRCKCFNFDSVAHMNFHVKDRKTNFDYVNIHLCWWNDGGSQCWGIYNSDPIQWCAGPFCLPGWPQLRGAISQGLQEAGRISAWAAAALAAILLFFASKGGAPLPA